MADENADGMANGRARFVGEALGSFEGPLLSYASRLLGDREQARDVVQETFLRLCKQRQHAVDGHLRRWLFTVCRNRALDELRRRKHHVPTNTTAVNGRASAMRGPAETIEVRDAAQTAAEALERLPEKEREAIHLKFRAGLSYREIAAVTGHSLSYVGVLIHTGMKRLRTELGPRLGTDPTAQGARR